MGVRRWTRWGGPARAAAAVAVVSLVGMAGALSAATVLAWSVGDFSISTTTYTSSAAPTPSNPGSQSAKAVVGQYVSDAQTVTVKGFRFLPASDYQFALYEGNQPPTCPQSVGGSNAALPSGYVFESGVYQANKTSPNSSNPPSATTTVSSTQASPGSYQVMAAGTYYWIARYYDTKDNITVFSKCTSEVVQVSAESPTITTMASPQSAVVGQPVTIGDTATFHNAAVAPTGKVTFTLYSDASCQTAVLSGSGPISSSGGASTASFSTSWTFNKIGSYYWVASYAGDNNNNGYTSPCQVDSETVTVTAESPTITTMASPQSVVVGQTVTIGDTATFQNAAVAPTGSVTFTLYSDASCQTAVVSGTGPIVTSEAGSTASFSTSWAFTQTGSYYWVASYAGDSNNNSYTSPCQVSSETVTVTAESPTITTMASPQSVVVGQPVTIGDVATFQNAAVAPTGSVTFTLYSGASCQTAVVSGSGPIVTSEAGSMASFSTSWTFSQTGSYYWVASYAGDSNNNGYTSPCQVSSETIKVTAESPTITTMASPQSVVVGQPVTIGDTATFQNAAVAPTGSVTFTLYSGASCQTAVVSGSGPIMTSEAGSTASFSTSWTFTQTGSYYWVASYAGDSNNNAYTSPCQVGSETVKVTAESPTITTQATPQTAVAGKSTTVGDTATFQQAMVPPTGSVDFTLYSNAACTDMVLTGSGPITTTAAGSTASFSTTWTPAQQGSYYWVATYAGDSNNNPYTSPCQVGSETITVSSSGGVLGASTTTPGTGADLAVPGAIATLLALLGAMMVAFGTRLRRRRAA